MTETHVVTLSMDFCDGSHVICELFRGDYSECRDLAHRIPGASDDQHPISGTHIQYAPIPQWEAYCRSLTSAGTA